MPVGRVNPEERSISAVAPLHLAPERLAFSIGYHGIPNA
jgi:hypothetical protein